MNHEERRKRINASEVGAIMGIDMYRTPLEVWQEKKGIVPPFAGNEHTERGKFMEPYALYRIAQDLGGNVSPNVANAICPNNDLFSATPDGLFFGESPEGVEVKTTLFRVQSISELEDMKLPWVWQCRFGMLCTGFRKWHLGIVGPMLSDFIRFEISHDQELENELVSYLEWWWRVHIIEGKQPESINEADVLRLWPRHNEQSIEASETLKQSIERYFALKDEAKALTEKAEQVREGIVLAIGPNESVTYASKRLCTYRADKRGIRSLRR